MAEKLYKKVQKLCRILNLIIRIGDLPIAVGGKNKGNAGLLAGFIIP